MALFNQENAEPVQKKKKQTRTKSSPAEVDAAAEPGSIERPIPQPEPPTPQLKEAGPTIFFSRWKGYKIGRIPTTVTYEMQGKVKKKVVHKGEKICFIDGRYVCKDPEEEAFLEKFMQDYPDRIFKFDPKQKALEMELLNVVARHKAAIAQATGKQGVSGAA